MENNIRIQQLQEDWATNPRWAGVKRTYKAADVLRLRGSIDIEYTLARRGAEKLWSKLLTNDFVAGLGCYDRKSGHPGG